MKNILRNIKEHYTWGLIFLITGIFLGWLFFYSSENENTSLNQELAEKDHSASQTTTWTCSMHPQIRREEPGKCPICAMDLIPLSDLQSDEADIHPDEIQMTESAAKLADIQTLVVRRDVPEKELFLQGKVKPDERRIAKLTARFGGRIEKLFISFTGENVKKGQKLATIYSPELVTAQRELLEATAYKEIRPNLYKAARTKLKLWDLTEGQIDNIEKNEEPKFYFDILSPISGTVTRRHVALGDYLKEGTALFEVIDLTHVWILFDAYESDLPWISIGDQVMYSLQSIPGESFIGKVDYIDPFIHPETRVAQVRVQQSNNNLVLKPEMFVNGYIKSKTASSSNEILIPKSSILWTGKRAVVYVKVPGRTQPSFIYKEINLGPESGNFYVVNDGLEEGEEIAVNGVFKIDAAAQLAGKPSMMNPEGGSRSAPHDHGGTTMTSIESAKRHDQISEEPDGSHPGNIDPEFKDQLKDVYDNYLKLKNALVKSNTENATEASLMVVKALDKVDMDLLKGKDHSTWMKASDQLKLALEQIHGSDNLDAHREAFANLSDALYESIKSFGINTSENIYYQYCPMAIEDKGAFWLSEVEEINNPYFGEIMLRCGETREIIK